MFSKQVFLLALFVLLLAAGCGHWPPIVNTTQDVLQLPPSEPSVRARGMADSDFPALARLRLLSHLDFSSGWGSMEAKITDDGLATLAKLNLPQLETLSLGWCDNITDAGLDHVTQIQSITSLQLPACRQITDAGLEKLANAPALKYLDVRGCSSITDKGIVKLAAKGNWEEILLGGCANVTAQGVAQLQALLPNAKISKNDQEWEFSSKKK